MTTTQLSGLYCTENKKRYRELLGHYLKKQEWKSVRPMWVMYRTSLYNNLFHLLSPVEIMLISQFAIGEFPIVLNEVSETQITQMNKYVASLPDIPEPNEEACKSSNDDVEEDNPDMYNSDYEDDYDYTDDPADERLGPEKKFIPLKNIELVAELNGYAANITISHTYVNTTDSALEGVFLLPKIDSRNQKIGVHGFEAIVDGKKIVGSLMEKEKAKELRAALAKSGEGSYLFESSDNAYSFSIGAIQPGQQAEIKISYVQLMDCDENGSVELCISKKMIFPMNGNGECPCELPGTTEGLRTKVIVKMPSKISQIDINTNDMQLIETSRTNKTANLTVLHHVFLKDLLLKIHLEEPNEPAIICENNNDDCAALLTYVPPAIARIPEAEIVFITETYNKSRREYVNKILSTVLEQLPGSCLFNVVDGDEFLFPESRSIAGNNIYNLLDTEVIRYYGASNIQDICRSINEKSQGLPIRIVYIGSGHVKNTVEACQMLNESPSTRFFGMMDDVFDGFKDLVKSGRGIYTQLTEDWSITEDTINRVCHKMLNPVYTLTEINWGTQLYQQHPAQIEKIVYGGELFSITSFLSTSDIQFDAPVAIKLVDQSGCEICKRIPLFPNKKLTGVHTLVAQRWIQEHEDQMNLDKEIKNLALKYNLVSKYTSFLSYQRQHEGGGFNLRVKHVPITFRKKEKTVIYDVYMAGSGLGIFERPACLQIHETEPTSLTKLLNRIDYDCSTIPTPLGINAYKCPLVQSEFSHVFKGPQADIEGHNCWLNATLALLFASDVVTNRLLAVSSNDGSILCDLSLLFKVWLQQDELEEMLFRKYFNFMYGRVWFHLQHLGFTYGEDFGVQSALSTILPLILDEQTSLRVASNVDDVCQMKDVEEVILFRQQDNDLVTINQSIPEDYCIKSFVSFQSLARTSQGRSVNHFSTVFPSTSGGIFIYDDILKFLNTDYQGGFVPYPNVEDWNYLTERIPVLLLKNLSSPATIQRTTFVDQTYVDQIMSLTKVVAEDTYNQFDFPNGEVIVFDPLTSRWTLPETLQILRWIRFSSQYGIVKGYNTFDVPTDYSKIQKSEGKIRMLIKQELEHILQSFRPVESFYKICKLGLWDSILSLPEKTLCSDPKVSHIDLMQGIKEMKRMVGLTSSYSAYQLMAAFLSCFDSLNYEHRVRRKKRTISVVHHLLGVCLLCSKKEIELVMSL